MARTCLQIIQAACVRIGILSPNEAVTSSNPQILQLLALANEEGETQAEFAWQVLQTEATFTTVATQLQGTLESIAPGYKYLTNDTIWDRTLIRPIYGSRSAQEWQNMVAHNLTAPYSQYRVKANALYFYPVPTAGNTCALEYQSKNWVSTSVGGTASAWSNDADTPFLDDGLMIKGIVWRWKAAKGLDYAEDFLSYERSLMEAKARDGSKPMLSLNGCSYEVIRPVVVIPSGSWGA